MLTKLPQVDFTPAVLYSPAQPERIVCPPVPPDAAPTPPVRSGYYTSLCLRPLITLPDGSKIQNPVFICTNVWVDTSG